MKKRNLYGIIKEIRTTYQKIKFVRNNSEQIEKKRYLFWKFKKWIWRSEKIEKSYYVLNSTFNIYMHVKFVWDTIYQYKWIVLPVRILHYYQNGRVYSFVCFVIHRTSTVLWYTILCCGMIWYLVFYWFFYTFQFCAILDFFRGDVADIFSI